MRHDNQTSQNSFSGPLLTGTVILTGIVLFWLGHNAYDNYRRTKTELLQNLKIEELRGVIVHLDEVLSMSARMAAISGDSPWEERYRAYEAELDKAIKQAAEIAPDAFNSRAAAAIDAANQKLVEMDNQAFAEVREGRLDAAQAILFSDSYEQQKRLYANAMTQFAVTRQADLRLQELRGTIIHLDEVLTMSARKAAMTGDLKWEARYRQYEPALNAAIEEAVALAPGSYSGAAAMQTDAANQRLVAMELQAFELIRHGRLSDAEELLFSPGYEEQKRIYAEGMAQFAARLQVAADNSAQEKQHRAFVQVAAVIITIATLMLAWVVVIVALRRQQNAMIDSHRQLLRQSEELARLNATLNERVEERTRELAASEAKALEVAREAKQARKVAENAEAELRIKNRDLEILFHVLSHDLREPLRGICGFSMLVLERYGEGIDEKGRHFLRRAVAGGERLQQLIDDILTLSRAERQIEPNDNVDGRSMVMEAVSRLEGKIVESGASVSIADEFPLLVVDKTWATQAIYNLIANALKFVEPGVAPEVEVRPYSNGEPGIVVGDRGPGVSPEQVDRIFELFQRSVGRDIEGTGAGLAIVRQIAERHGGRAWVRPRAGGGSEFVVTFSGRTG